MNEDENSDLNYDLRYGLTPNGLPMFRPMIRDLDLGDSKREMKTGWYWHLETLRRRGNENP